MPKMQDMEESKARQEDNEEIIKMNIKQFIEATRQLAAAQPALAPIPVRKDR
jgi:hypothetical protein